MEEGVEEGSRVEKMTFILVKNLFTKHRKRKKSEITLRSFGRYISLILLLQQITTH